MTAALSASDALHARARGLVHAYRLGAHPPESFESLARDLARFQAEHIPGYARLCAARGVDPATLDDLSRAPAVPSDAFKLARVFAFDDASATIAFRTSGTTIGARGTHRMRNAGTYDAASSAFGARMLFGGLPHPTPVWVIGPPPEEARDSSLTHMCALFVERLAPPRADGGFFVRGGALDVESIRRRRADLETAPIVVLATSFALVHLIDALGGDTLPLPEGSRVMQTGGTKGRSREVSPVELRRDVARVFAIDERDVVGEYGMTELSSQFWEATAVDPDAARGVYVEPPWARVVPVDGETLAPVPEGEAGLARIEDLANVDSAWAVLTQDRVRRVSGGFELLGRAPGAPPRGCSIALDEMLSASAGASGRS